MQKQTHPTSTSPKSSHILTFGLVGLVVVALAAILIVQQVKITNLIQQLSSQSPSQLPQKIYANYDDCMGGGGVPLIIENGQFDACLGGDMDETGEMPQYQAILQYSAQSLPRITENEPSETENRVTSEPEHSADLIAFLEQDYTGCDPRGEYEIVREVKDRFALLKYGCDGDGQVQSNNPPTMIAMKLSDGWVLLSPTNNMDEAGRPSCLMQDMFKISKELAPQCFENTGNDNGALRKRDYR